LTFEDDVAAVTKFVQTERQARFVTVSGTRCVPRQFATFAARRGHK
jgi:hypothetical protein